MEDMGRTSRKRMQRRSKGIRARAESVDRVPAPRKKECGGVPESLMPSIPVCRTKNRVGRVPWILVLKSFPGCRAGSLESHDAESVQGRY